MFVCSGLLFGRQVNAFLLEDPVIVPANPTIKDHITAEFGFGFCYLVMADHVEIEGNIIKLTVDIFDTNIITCPGDLFLWITSIGQLPAGNYELEFYRRIDSGDGYGDPELQAVIPFVVNGIAVPINHWLTLALLIIGFSWLAMRTRLS